MRSAAAIAAIACLCLCGCGSSQSTTTTSTPTTTTGHTVASSSTQVARRPRPGPKPACPSDGAKPQTDKQPSAATACFQAKMNAFWRGVSTGSAAPAMPAFFPEAAYAQIKAEPDPRGDWLIRLVLDYRLDVGAAHRLVGPGARLVGVEVPTSYAHWVPPGVCYNSGGYWEVPNARVVYRTAGGEIKSFGIASMISWRGIWYIVHLGSTHRVGNIPVLDSPSAGHGVSLNSGTC
jgi:hypothetical protein